MIRSVIATKLKYNNSCHLKRCFFSTSITMHSRSDVLISPSELHSTLEGNDSEKVVVLDSSWFMPALKVNSHEQFLKQRLPTAQFFNVDTIVDGQCTQFPHTICTSEEFNAHTKTFGVDADTLVRLVFYYMSNT